MRQQRYTEEFRRESIRQVAEKGHPVKEVAEPPSGDLFCVANATARAKRRADRRSQTRV